MISSVKLIVLAIFTLAIVHQCFSQEDNMMNIDADGEYSGISTNKCPPGEIYSAGLAGCKPIIRSVKSVSQRLLALMPYFANNQQAASVSR